MTRVVHSYLQVYRIDMKIDQTISILNAMVRKLEERQSSNSDDESTESTKESRFLGKDTVS